MLLPLASDELRGFPGRILAEAGECLLLPFLDFGPATEYGLISRLSAPFVRLAPAKGIPKLALMGLAVRPFSACIIGKLRDH